MSEFLSPAWVAALADAAARADVPDDVDLVVQQVVVDGRDGDEAAYALRIAGGALTVTDGRVDAADVTFTQDRATASAIARGELSAQAAFVDGRLRVGGDLGSARAAARALAVIADVFAAPRATTTW